MSVQHAMEMSHRSAYEPEGKVSSTQVTMDDEMDHNLSPEKAGTRLDQMDMRRMGKPQEFRVRLSCEGE